MASPDDLTDKFWSKVRKSEGCWEWGSHLNVHGYGHYHEGSRTFRAHRFSWELTNGPIPTGLFVLHKCDNRKCVRPDHLFLGTQADNMRDCAAKGRIAATKLTPDAIRAIRSSELNSVQLAPAFGVSSSAIRKIRGGFNWKHLKEAA